MDSLVDIFDREQSVLNRAADYSASLNENTACSPDEFRNLTREYGKLLKQLRRITKLSDKAANTLNTSKLDLLDRVHIDPLTGIFNRRYLEENLLRVLKTLARGAGELSVMFIDIDYFKKYNDHYGHGKGDECLIAVAQAMSGVIARADDFVARYGGEEFVIVLPNTDEDGARLLATRVLEAVRTLAIPHAASDVCECVTVSIGVTSAIVGTQQSPTDFLRRSDTALYAAKRDGRNRYTFINLEEVS